MSAVLSHMKTSTICDRMDPQLTQTANEDGYKAVYINNVKIVRFRKRRAELADHYELL